MLVLGVYKPGGWETGKRAKSPYSEHSSDGPHIPPAFGLEEWGGPLSYARSTEFGGRTLTVNEAKPQAPRTGGGRGGSDGGDFGGSKRRSRF